MGNEIRVITISREFGSGGEAIARILGARLNWRLVDDSLVAELAKRVHVDPKVLEHCDENLDSWFHRLNKALWHGGFEGSVAQTEYHAFDSEDLARLWSRVIKEAAQLGHCVVVGRGGQCLLQDRKDTFHVSVYAPMSYKMARLRERLPAVEDLEALARETDRRRAAYVRHHFNHDWADRHLYDLMICSTIGLEQTAQAILCAAGLDRTGQHAGTNDAA